MRPKPTFRWRWLGLSLALAAGAALAATAVPPAAGPGRALVRVEGLGWIRDYRLRQTLLLLLGDERQTTLGANAIEDAALIVFSTLGDVGYLDPTVRVQVRSADGRTQTFPLDPQLEKPLPRTLAATEVVFQIRRGRRIELTGVRFEGLSALRDDQARPYFRGDGLLASFTAERSYSPARLQRSMGNLAEELRHRGYAEVVVTAGAVELDHAHGRARVVIIVRQGPLWRVREVRYQMAGHGTAPSGLSPHLGRPWTRAWQHDLEKIIRAWYYQRGYPDLALKLTPEAAPPEAGERAVTVVADLAPGSGVRLGQVRFVGNVHIRESVLRPLLQIKPGAPLDPIKMEDAQVRISRLGAFRTVDLRYDPAVGATRDAIYQLQEGKRQEVSLLLGWGTFDELRTGVEWRDYNLFHESNQGTLKLVQSLKSSEGEYDYVVPELFGTSIDGTAKVFGFDRHQRSFLDEEYGATLAALVPWRRFGMDMTAGYTFLRVRASDDTLATYQTDLTHANATSVQLAFTRDRRDNPLLPRHGYKVSLQLEEASRLLGGQVDFQEAQLGLSYHTAWTDSRWIHLGLNHAVITTFGAPAGNQIPPNVLFYPGGEDSIRGYGQGEAAPRVGGQFVGAYSTTLLNVELEQALTSKFSVVGFSDSLMAAAAPGEYPFGHRLYSAGLGLRLQTFVGPIRLEYGENLNRRAGDPRGTLQFSVGFPF